MSRNVKTNSINDVRKACQNIGDSLATAYNGTGDLKVAQGALSAYKTAINAAKTQIIYKKLTGKPGKIAFCD